MLNLNKYYIQSFWKSLPTKSLVKLLIAIFFLFSSFGFSVDLLNNATQSYSLLAINVFFSGLLGVFYGLGAMKNWKIIPITIIFHLAYSTYFVDKIPAVGFINSEEKLVVISIGLVVTITLAYVAFIIFIVGEGIPQIKLRTEMDLTKQMHDVLVPVINFENDKFSIYGKSQPIAEVGGDLVDIFSNKDNLLCYIADVSGHGISAGLFMGMFKSSVRTSLQNSKSIKEIFNDANKALNNLRKQNMFLTSEAIQFLSDNYAEYLVAGHLPILHFMSEQKQLEELNIKQIPVSVKADFNFESKKVEYKKGDMFILLSDGITEVFTKDKEQFGLSRIKKIILDNYKLSTEEIFNKIIRAVDIYGIQKDDQTLMIIKCK